MIPDRQGPNEVVELPDRPIGATDPETTTSPETTTNPEPAPGPETTTPRPTPTPSRRTFLATSATSIGGVAAGAAASALLLDDTGPAAAPAGDLVAGLGTATVPVPFPHQAGISVPARQQGHGTVAAFDLVPGASPAQLKALMQAWTSAIADLTAGRTPTAAPTATDTADTAATETPPPGCAAGPTSCSAVSGCC